MEVLKVLFKQTSEPYGPNIETSGPQRSRSRWRRAAKAAEYSKTHNVELRSDQIQTSEASFTRILPDTRLQFEGDDPILGSRQIDKNNENIFGSRGLQQKILGSLSGIKMISYTVSEKGSLGRRYGRAIYYYFYY